MIREDAEKRGGSKCESPKCPARPAAITGEAQPSKNCRGSCWKLSESGLRWTSLEVKREQLGGHCEAVEMEGRCGFQGHQGGKMNRLGPRLQRHTRVKDLPKLCSLRRDVIN